MTFFSSASHFSPSFSLSERNLLPYEEHIEENRQHTTNRCDQISLVIILGILGTILLKGTVTFLATIGIGGVLALAAIAVIVITKYYFNEHNIAYQLATNHVQIDDRYLTVSDSRFDIDHFESHRKSVARKHNIRTLSIEGHEITIDLGQLEKFYPKLCHLYDEPNIFYEEDFFVTFHSLFGDPSIHGIYLNALPLSLLAMPAIDDLNFMLTSKDDLEKYYKGDRLTTYSFSCNKLYSSALKRPCQIVHSDIPISFTIDVEKIPEGSSETLPLTGSTPLSLSEYLANLPYVEEVRLTRWGMELPIYTSGIKSTNLIGVISALEGFKSSTTFYRTCLECCLKESVQLNISRQNLDQLPHIFFYLDHLEDIVISNNPLKKIPEALLRLPKLKSLTAEYCQLNDLPVELANCNCLTRLAVRDNRFEQFPEIILQIPNLQALTISYDSNQSPHAIHSLCSLTYLERLYIRSSKLVTLPEELVNLTKLRILDLEDNQLETIPLALTQLPQLHALNLQRNPIKSLPNWLPKMENLSRLKLPDFNSEELPRIIYELKELQKLRLNMPCDSRVLLKLTVACPKLREVKFMDFNFRWKQQDEGGPLLQFVSNELSIAPSIAVNSPVDTAINFDALCSKLEEWQSHNKLFQKVCKTVQKIYLLRHFNLDLVSMNLSELPDIFDFLPWLKRLSLTNNNLTALPPSLQSCSNLELLNLQNNKINDATHPIFEVITQLLSLNKLVLGGNIIPRIPDEIKNLSNLKKLEIQNCQLIEISPELWQCPVLNEIQLDHNPDLQSLPDGIENAFYLRSMKLGATQLNKEIQASISKQCRRQLRRSLLHEELKNWVKYSDEARQPPNILHLDDVQCQSLETWLFPRLAESKDFEYAASRKLLASRVLQIIDSAMEDKAFGEQFFAQLENANTGCGDMGAMGFNIINLLWELHCAGNISTDKRLKLMVRAAKTLTLRIELQQLMNFHVGPDFGESVEVFLYYEVHLQQQLDLLTFYQHLLHPDLGQRDWVDEKALQTYVEESFVFQLIDLPGFDAVAQEDEIYKNKKEEANNSDPYIDRDDYDNDYDYIQAIESLGKEIRKRTAALARDLVERRV